MTKDIALVYMVAGISRRFGGKIKGLTEIMQGKTLIDISLQQAVPAGFSKIVFITGEQTRGPFEEHFGSSYRGLPVFYALQTYDSALRDKPWGTADAICSAREFLNCPFVVCNGDDLYGSRAFQVLASHLSDSKDAAAIGYRLYDNVPEVGGVNRATFTLDGEEYVKDIKETTNIMRSSISEMGLSVDDLCSMNIFALPLEVLALLEERVRLFKKSHEGNRTAECYLPTELSILISQGLRMKLYSSHEACTGITNPGDEEIVRKELAKGI